MDKRRYEVVLNTSERFTAVVLASSKREAAVLARRGEYEDGWASMDRKITGVVSVEEAPTP